MSSSAIDQLIELIPNITTDPNTISLWVWASRQKVALSTLERRLTVVLEYDEGLETIVELFKEYIPSYFLSDNAFRGLMSSTHGSIISLYAEALKYDFGLWDTVGLDSTDDSESVQIRLVGDPELVSTITDTLKERVLSDTTETLRT